MKVICLQEKLKKALNIAERVTGKNVNLPILSNVLLETEKGRLKISATDLEMGLRTWISSKVEKEGKTSVSVGILSNFISSLPQEKTYLELKGKYDLEVKCENFKAIIKGLDPNDFPIIPQIKSEPSLVIKSENLQKGLLQIYQAATFSEVRPEISGVYFYLTKEKLLKMVATDSFRLAEKTLKKFETKQSKELSFIVPLKTIVELVRILDGFSGNVKITIKENQVLFDIDDIHLVSRLIEGRFPDYQRIIPTEFETTSVIDREKLIEAIRIASLFAGKINDVSLNFLPPEKIEISSESQEVGSHQSSLKAEVSGKKNKLTFNYKYLLDGLNNIDKERVVFEVKGSEEPAKLKPFNDLSYLYIVMPVRNTE